MAKASVCVMLAAYNAQETITSAIRSALAEPEVAQILMVDDCSTDSTVQTALTAANGDDRLTILSQEKNQGPAAARNRAMETATAAYVAILDADDVFIPGRLARALSVPDWDFCADNIVFVRDRSALDRLRAFETPAQSRFGQIDLQNFVSGNLMYGPIKRSELGFLKPIMRREFLTQHGLRYDEVCRLGEDFLLYSKALIGGARFVVLEECGYGALERENSLSALHSIAELVSFQSGIESLCARGDIAPEALKVLKQFRKQIGKKIAHRDVLNVRQEKGIAAGILKMFQHPSSIRNILNDKLGASNAPSDVQRMLFKPNEFDAMIL